MPLFDITSKTTCNKLLHGVPESNRERINYSHVLRPGKSHLSRLFKLNTRTDQLASTSLSYKRDGSYGQPRLDLSKHIGNLNNHASSLVKDRLNYDSSEHEPKLKEALKFLNYAKSRIEARKSLTKLKFANFVRSEKDEEHAKINYKLGDQLLRQLHTLARAENRSDFAELINEIDQQIQGDAQSLPKTLQDIKATLTTINSNLERCNLERYAAIENIDSLGQISQLTESLELYAQEQKSPNRNGLTYCTLVKNIICVQHTRLSAMHNEKERNMLSQEIHASLTELRDYYKSIFNSASKPTFPVHHVNYAETLLAEVQIWDQHLTPDRRKAVFTEINEHLTQAFIHDPLNEYAHDFVNELSSSYEDYVPDPVLSSYCYLNNVCRHYSFDVKSSPKYSVASGFIEEIIGRIDSTVNAAEKHLPKQTDQESAEASQQPSDFIAGKKKLDMLKLRACLVDSQNNHQTTKAALVDQLIEVCNKSELLNVLSLLTEKNSQHDADLVEKIILKFNETIPLHEADSYDQDSFSQKQSRITGAKAYQHYTNYLLSHGREEEAIGAFTRMREYCPTITEESNETLSKLNKKDSRLTPYIDKSTVFVLFGCTGDLAIRKIIPEIIKIIENGQFIDKDTKIIFSNRHDISLNEFFQLVHDRIHRKGKFANEKFDPEIDKIWIKGGVWEKFNKYRHFFKYIQADTQDINSFHKLKEEVEKHHHVKNVNFYVSTWPELFSPYIQALDHVNIFRNFPNGRIILEKPFMESLLEARKLIQKIGKLCSINSDQIVSIDHYTTKDTFNGLLNFRLLGKYEKFLNAEFVESIEIIADESIGLTEDRAKNYVGVLKDMLQNHLVQFLSLILMDHPDVEDSKAFHAYKAQAISDLNIVPGMDKFHQLLLKQYGTTIDSEGRGGTSLAFTDQIKNSASLVPTFFALRTTSKNSRFGGQSPAESTAILARSGKLLKEKVAALTINFRQGAVISNQLPSKIIFAINPKAMIIEIGHDGKIIHDYSDELIEKPKIPGLEAYGKLIFDPITGGDSSAMGGLRKTDVTNEFNEASWRWLDEMEKIENAHRAFPKAKEHQGHTVPHEAETMIHDLKSTNWTTLADLGQAG